MYSIFIRLTQPLRLNQCNLLYQQDVKVKKPYFKTIATENRPDKKPLTQKVSEEQKCPHPEKRIHVKNCN
jgi:hypothetical protein